MTGIDWPRVIITVLVLLPIALILWGFSSFLHTGTDLNGNPVDPIRLTDFAVHLDGDRWNGPVFIKYLTLDAARVIDWTQETQFKPAWRTFGIHVPGLFGLLKSYRAGWFKLCNGERALLHIAGTLPVLLIPTSKDFVLMLGVAEPQQLLEALKARQQAEVAGVRPSQATRS